MFVSRVELLWVMFTSGSEDRTFLIVSERAAARHQHNVLMKVLIESRVFDF